MIAEASEGVNLVSFPGGVPQDVEEMEVIFGEKQGSSKRKRCVVGDLNGLSFKALDSGDAAAKHGLCKYGIVKVNTETKSMELIGVSNVFAMRPQINKDGANAPARLSAMTPDERRKSLHEFGSSKKQRALKQAASNQIQDSTVSGASAVEKAILNATATENVNEDENALMEDAAEYALEQSRRNLLPTYDTKATDYSEAYPREKLVSLDLNDELLTLYDTLLPEDIGQTKSKKVIAASVASVLSHLEDSLKGPKTIISLLQGLEVQYTEMLANSAAGEGTGGDGAGSGSTMKKKTLNRLFRGEMALLLHLHFVIGFYRAITKSTRGATPKTEISSALKAAPPALIDELLKKFAHTSKRQDSVMVTVEQRNRDKLMCYMMVLGMHLSQNSFDLTVLAGDLKASEAHAVKYVRMLGMRTVKVKSGEGGASHTAAELSVLPLAFPGPPKRAAKK